MLLHSLTFTCTETFQTGKAGTAVNGTLPISPSSNHLDRLAYTRFEHTENRISVKCDVAKEFFLSKPGVMNICTQSGHQSCKWRDAPSLLHPERHRPSVFGQLWNLPSVAIISMRHYFPSSLETLHTFKELWIRSPHRFSFNRFCASAAWHYLDVCLEDI